MERQRNTKQRQMILDMVRARRDHPVADQIYLDARAVDSKISRGTVYRNLNVLTRNGEILHVKVPGADRFDCRLDYHYHLLCTGCGAVCDAPIPYDEQPDRAIEGLTGYAVARHRTVFEGLCPQCRAKAEKEAKP